MFPTRYSLELEGAKGVVTADTFKEPSQREDAKKNVKKLFEEKYVAGKNKWFFQPLRVRGIVVRTWLALTSFLLVLSAGGRSLLPDTSSVCFLPLCTIKPSPCIASRFMHYAHVLLLWRLRSRRLNVSPRLVINANWILQRRHKFSGPHMLPDSTDFVLYMAATWPPPSQLSDLLTSAF